MLKILHVVGARPNFMKIAPLMSAFDAINAASPEPMVKQLLVHTGQHYSPEMSSLLFEQLALPEPDINLEVGSGSHGDQTGRIMIEFEKVLQAEQPDLVVVVGDVNSTIACAMDAKKLQIPVAHVEAGLRSFDSSMPEEINRVLTDSISDLMYTTEAGAGDNLIKEGCPVDKIQFVGNTMIDTLLKHREKALERPTLQDLGLSPQGYAVVTLHRPSNVDDEDSLRGILEALSEISKDIAIVFPIHPRTQSRVEHFGLQGLIDDNPNFHTIGPQGYLDFINLTANARIVLSDSGGIQEETTVLKVPCLTLRPNTERPITITEGTNQLVATNKAAILEAYQKAMDTDYQDKAAPQFWDGKAASRIAEHMVSWLKQRNV